MNFDGFGGLALAIVAGLWLMVFVPSWFKRSQDRERGIVAESWRTARNGRIQRQNRRPSVDNFTALAREYAQQSEVEVTAEVEVAGWSRQELPEPRNSQGTLEKVQLADVTSLEVARSQVAAKALSQAELDEILRRRRANG